MAVSHPPPAGMIIAAPASHSGKTLVCALLGRGIEGRGIDVRWLKTGPDYLDPIFHRAVSGRACENIDLWAMGEGAIRDVLDHASRPRGRRSLILCEAVMGLFDAGRSHGSSGADLAARTGWPVVLVVNAARSGESICALIQGFCRYRGDIDVAGVILNRVASASHAALLERALAEAAIPLFGIVRHSWALAWPSRHLGLTPPRGKNLPSRLDRALRTSAAAIDLDAVIGAARPIRSPLDPSPPDPFPGAPWGMKRLAIARDEAFAFLYPHHLRRWRAAGAAVTFFSPLADQAPPDADGIFLPGGYPELYAERLADCSVFRQGLIKAARDGVFIYGECGGFMTLGESLSDTAGGEYPMVGLLPLRTRMGRKLSALGYREIRALADSPLGAAGTLWRGHEFHYARTLQGGTPDSTAPLFADTTHQGMEYGMRRGSVMGSFVHLIDQA